MRLQDSPSRQWIQYQFDFSLSHLPLFASLTIFCTSLLSEFLKPDNSKYSSQSLIAWISIRLSFLESNLKVIWSSFLLIIMILIFSISSLITYIEDNRFFVVYQVWFNSDVVSFSWSERWKVGFVSFVALSFFWGTLKTLRNTKNSKIIFLWALGFFVSFVALFKFDLIYPSFHCSLTPLRNSEPKM